MVDHVPTMRRYSDQELNQLLGALRTTLHPHHPTVGLLLAMALFLEMIYATTQRGDEDDWMTNVVPYLQRELLRGTAAVLCCGVVAVDDSSQDRMH